jgi:Tfp pilus assembly protein PilF
LQVLKAAYDEDPANRDLLIALITIHRDQGDLSAARSYAQALRVRWPEDPQAQAIGQELEP